MAADKTKMTLGCVTSIGGFVQLGIWFYLLYQILDKINATSPMWTAYWVYVPVGVLVACYGAVIKAITDAE